MPSNAAHARSPRTRSRVIADPVLLSPDVPGKSIPGPGSLRKEPEKVSGRDGWGNSGSFRPWTAHPNGRRRACCPLPAGSSQLRTRPVRPWAGGRGPADLCAKKFGIRTFWHNLALKLPFRGEVRTNCRGFHGLRSG